MEAFLLGYKPRRINPYAISGSFTDSIIVAVAGPVDLKEDEICLSEDRKVQVVIRLNDFDSGNQLLNALLEGREATIEDDLEWGNKEALPQPPFLKILSPHSPHQLSHRGR